MSLLRNDIQMSQIVDETTWRKQGVDGYVMANFLLDPRIIRDELNIESLHYIDDILTFIKKNIGQT